MTERAREIATGLAQVRQRIVAAMSAAGRDDPVTLVVVTKTWPASDVELLAGLGVTDVAENRDQEARPKHDACAILCLRWHFVGQLQRNKARAVAAGVGWPASGAGPAVQPARIAPRITIPPSRRAMLRFIVPSYHGCSRARHSRPRERTVMR